MTDRSLIYGENAKALAAQVHAALPQEDVAIATRPEDLAPALAEHAPDAVFSIKSMLLGPETHAPILTAPSVRWLHVGGSGYEHVVGRDAGRLTLTNCVGVLAPFLAETVIGALVAMNSGLFRYHRQQAQHLWQTNYFRPLAGQTLLVAGAGAIGAEVAKRAAALGMHVIGIRRSATPVEGCAEMRPPEALIDSLAEADAVSVHLRLTAETEGMFSAATFAAMKPGAKFINTARGGHVVEPDLIAALESGHLSGAYLDVCQTEPLPESDPLWDTPNLLITPHASDQVTDWEARFNALFIENLQAWRKGRELRNLV